jgi:hypothetical protein
MTASAGVLIPTIVDACVAVAWAARQNSANMTAAGMLCLLYPE